MLAAVSCKKDETRQPDSSYNPVIQPENFTNSTTITNPYFPLTLGKKYIYEGQSEDGLERIEIQRLDKPKSVLGIPCAVINDKVWINGILVEDTDDWYAQDNNGNVWYMGEYVTDYNSDGSVKDHDGSWEAGVDGAKPGFIMVATPQPGISYRQEYYFDEAEDEASVEAVGLSLAVPVGAFTNCIKIKEWTELEPDKIAYKYYAPGLGMIKEEEDNAAFVLIKIE